MICVNSVGPVSGKSRRRAYYLREDGRKTTTSYARLLAAIKVGRALRKDECAHHVNRNRRDDRLTNIEVMTWYQHAMEHAQSGDFRARAQREAAT